MDVVLAQLFACEKGNYQVNPMDFRCSFKRRQLPWTSSPQIHRFGVKVEYAASAISFIVYDGIVEAMVQRKIRKDVNIKSYI